MDEKEDEELYEDMGSKIWNPRKNAEDYGIWN